MEVVNNNTEVNVQKKKGRPRKNPIIEVPEVAAADGEVEKKKRGRKKKEKVEEEVKPKKKRGRKAAVKFFSSSIRKKIPLTTVIQDNDRSILHLDIKDEPTSLKQESKTVYDVVRGEYSDSNLDLVIRSSQILELSEASELEEKDELEEYIDTEDVSISELYKKKVEARRNQDEILLKRLENLHNDENLIEKLSGEKFEAKDNVKTKNGENRKKGYFQILENFYESKKWLETTDVCCWWCCNKFNTIPVGLPISFKKGKFCVRGIFCGFGCMIAYKNSHPNKLNASCGGLINYLFKKLTGVLIVPSIDNYKQTLNQSLKIELFGGDESLKNEYIESLVKLCCEKLVPAPPRETLKMFGGELSIEEFRSMASNQKVYKMIEYPMCVSRDYIEEVDIQNVKNINSNVFNQTFRKKNNMLDDQQVEDAKHRIQNKNNNVVTNNSIDKFLKF
jgi:hypothetical protein